MVNSSRTGLALIAVAAALTTAAAVSLAPAPLALVLAIVGPLAVGGFAIWTQSPPQPASAPPAAIAPPSPDTKRLKEQLAKQTELRIKAEEALDVAKDEAQTLGRAKSAFLANMSHELRTPLNAILGYADLIGEDASDAGDHALAQDVEKIGRAGKHLLALVSDILDLTKIESGHAKVHLEEIDIIWFCDQVLEVVKPRAEQNGNHLRTNYRGELGRIVADARKLRQALLNLLGNACKFTADGDILLEVHRYDESGRPWLELAVVDTGVGLTVDQQVKVFDEFAQADDSVERKFGGTGLGLPISRRLCQVMGGDIIVDSTLGDGSRFAIRIPIHNQPGMEPAPNRGHFPGAMNTPSVADTLDNATRRALLIGHDPDVRETISQHLSQDGFEVTSAAEGAAGIMVARSWRPDVIVLDIMLPDMDHWQILRVIKQDPLIFEIPVLMLAISDRKGIALGVRDYLVKPVSAARLLGAIDALEIPETGTVLVVEDDVASREVTERQLRGRDWTVANASDGAEALAWLEDNTPVLILLDLMMPDVDGFEVISALQSRPEWASIPVVVLSAMEIPPRLKVGLEGRVQSAVEQRGMDPDTLVSRIRDLLGTYGD